MYILTTFFPSLLKVLTAHIISSCLYAPKSSIPCNMQHSHLILPHEVQGCWVLAHNTWQAWTIKSPFLPSRQLLSVQGCLAWENHLMAAGRGENWQSTGELGSLCFSCSVTDRHLLHKIYIIPLALAYKINSDKAFRCMDQSIHFN